MKLDISRVWQDASALVSANRDVLLAVAGVFFVLPALTVAWLFPTPDIDPEANPRAVLAVALEHFREIAPWQALSGVAAAIGVLALLVLMTDRNRPTVGAAIGEGLRGVLSYIAISILSAMIFMVLILLVVLVAGSTGSVAIAVLLGLLATAATIYLMLRWNQAVPVIAIERVRNPITALQRSWQLTEGNAGRILLFLFLLGLVYFVIMLIATGIVAGLAALAFGAEAGRFAGAFVGSVLGGTFLVYVTASQAAMHSQLGGGVKETADRFD